jgi:endonuclease-8
MPEGPEIRRAADRLDQVLRGKPARLVEFAFPHLAADGVDLTGRRIVRATARSKAMLIHFEGGRTLYSHNQLYGEWAILTARERPSETRQIRVAIHVDRAVAVLYSASEIEVWNTAEVGGHPYIAKLGIELLDRDTRLADVVAQIEAPRFAHASLGSLLLDQRFLSGIGNYLRSEILFVAGIGPDARIRDLDPRTRKKLARAAIALTRQSYRTAGITNDPHIVRQLRAAGAGFEAYRFRVFDREGEACYACGTTIRRINVSGRGLFYCPSCQSASPD